MKEHLTLGAVILLCACTGTPPPEEGSQAIDTAAQVHATLPEPVEWTGYYDGVFRYSQGRDVSMRLWVREDSTFVLQQEQVGKDGIPEGFVGRWHIAHVEGAPADGLLSIAYGGDPPDHYRFTEKGLLFVDVINGYDENDEWVMEKLADAIGDAVPRMRLRGAFTYFADSQRFRPCGTSFNWPCVGGMDMGEEEGEPLVAFNNLDLQKAYRQAVKNGGDPWYIEAVCTMGMGPAMEGDGADEYIYIEQVIATLPDPCP